MPKAQKRSKSLIWNDLPTHANRCAKAPGISESAPVHQMLCVECKRPMWTRDEKREDLCEGCEWQLKEKVADMQQIQRKANTDRLVVPTGTGESFVNPFRGNSGGGLF